MMVNRRRAPMFSVRSLTWTAVRRDLLQSVFGELDREAFRRHQGLILP